MTYARKSIRPGMTAIAAVLALSSTPLLAQAADPAPATPVVVAPPAPVAVPVAPAAPRVAPAAPVAVAPIAPARAPAASGAGAPVTPHVAEAQVREEPAAAVRRAPARAERAAAPASADVAPAPAATAELTPASPALVAAPMPTDTAPVAMTDAAAAEPAGDDILPIAGIAGAGILALAGGAFALSRRRRHEDEEYDAALDIIESDHVTRVEPAPVPAAPISTPPVAATAVPAGMDLSRYGRHVQAAYRGPTPDNPSLSLRKRLKRARFFDQRERMAREGIATPDAAPAPVATPAAARTVEPAAAPRRTVSRPASQPFGSFRPAFQS